MLANNIDELEKIRAACKSMVRKRAVVSAGTTLIPVPGADIVADVGLLINLLPSINKKFGLTPEQIEELDHHHKAMLYAIMKQVGADLAGKAITKQMVMVLLKRVGIRMGAKQVFKYIPGPGQIVAAALGGAAMMYVGNTHVDECFNIVKDVIEQK